MRTFAAVILAVILLTANCVYAEELPRGAYYLDGELVLPPKAQAKKFKEGDFIINKKGLKHSVVLELGWGGGEYGVARDCCPEYGPNGLAVDKNGDIYIGDKVGRRILVYNPAGKFKKEIKDSMGGELLTIGDDGLLYSYFYGSSVMAIHDKNGNKIKRIEVPRMSSNDEISNIVVKDGEIYIQGMSGYQHVKSLENYRGDWGYIAVLDNYIAGYPYEEFDYHKGKKLNEIEPYYKELDMGNSTGRSLNKGYRKSRPQVFKERYGAGDTQYILNVYGEDGIETESSIVLYRCYLGEFYNLIFVDQKGNVYQLYSHEDGMRLVKWSE